MNLSIFPNPSMDRNYVKWEESLDLLTPWECHEGIWFKREDQFAPLGYGGPNGSKMRQLIWYINRYRGGKTHIVTGASVQSPQLSMTAIVGAHYRLPSTQVVYSRPRTLMGHPNPRIAAGFGASFEYARGPYNPIIQARVQELIREDSLVVHYGISLPKDRFSPEEIWKFHDVGARQVAGLPKDLRTLIVPAGSCNTLASVVLGLTRDRGNLERLYTIGIGPDKRAWLEDRLIYAGVDLKLLKGLKWRHHSLHDTGYSSYSDKFTGEAWDGIEFHPTYEAKIWRYLREHSPLEADDKTGLWIVGSAADPRVLDPFMTTRGAVCG